MKHVEIVDIFTHMVAYFTLSQYKVCNNVMQMSNKLSVSYQKCNKFYSKGLISTKQTGYIQGDQVSQSHSRRCRLLAEDCQYEECSNQLNSHVGYRSVTYGTVSSSISMWSFSLISSSLFFQSVPIPGYGSILLFN